jgi:Tol biopolymer transport system component
LGEGWGEAFAQLPETDIFIADIKYIGGNISFSKPINITNRKGYDNQPYFMPDGKSLLFVAIPDSTQSDIFKYDFVTKKISAITRSEESEYSPSLSPDGKNISVVRVDKDKGQRFYNLALNKTSAAALIKNSDAIGYYCWLNDTFLAMFVLGDAYSLQLLNTKTAEKKIIASDVGRCMKLSPDKKNLFFVIKQNENEWAIFSMDISTNKITKVIPTLPRSEDYTLLPDGTFLMGKDGRLFSFNPATSNVKLQTSNELWKQVADFSSSLNDFYRITINAKGDKIALVAFTGKKP